MVNKMDKYYKKEVEKATKRGASANYIADMEFAAQFDGLHNGLTKYIKANYEMFKDIQGKCLNGKQIDEKEALEIMCGKTAAYTINYIRKKLGSPPQDKSSGSRTEVS